MKQKQIKLLQLFLITQLMCSTATAEVATVNFPKIAPLVVPKTPTTPAPAAKAATPPVAKVVTPSVVAKTPPAPVPKVVTPKAVVPKAVTPIAPKPTVADETTKLPVHLRIANSSKYPATLTGFGITTSINEATQKIEQTLSKTSKIPPHSKPNSLSQKDRALGIKFNMQAPIGTFFNGIHEISINNQKVSTIYKDQPWNNTVTDAIYITSKDGTQWELDNKAMDTAYRKNSLGKQNTLPATTKPLVTSTTNAVASALLHKKTPPTTAPLVKNKPKSLSSKATSKALKTVTP